MVLSVVHCGCTIGLLRIRACGGSLIASEGSGGVNGAGAFQQARWNDCSAPKFFASGD
jgi:hypothetical protein